jgi:hypothetical protein
VNTPLSRRGRTDSTPQREPQPPSSITRKVTRCGRGRPGPVPYRLPISESVRRAAGRRRRSGA